MLLADVPWPRIPEAALLLVPIGATEQHGPHLPFTVDADIADAVARTVADALGPELPTVLAPVLAYGSSGEHADFPGTLSIGQEALRLVLIELARSADWAARVLFVNGHGGNGESLVAAVRQLRVEGREVAWLSCAPAGSDLHAGTHETSVMLSLRPDAVGEARPVGASGSVAELMPQLREHGVRSVSENGVLGDAGGASAESGAAALAAVVSAAVARFRRWQPDENGMLR